MRLVLLPFLALALSAPAPAPEVEPPVSAMPLLNPVSAREDCPETPMSLARKRAERPQAVPLDELPDAMLLSAVDRRIGGCPAPVIVRYDIGKSQGR